MDLKTWRSAQSLQVAALEQGSLLGRLSDFQFDLDTYEIYGWLLKGSGVFSKTGGVASRKLSLLGQDLAFVQSESAVEWSGHQPSAAAGRAWASTYNNTDVMVRRGSTLGNVQDFVIDREGNRVTGLLLTSSLLLPLDGQVRLATNSVIVPNADVATKLPGDESDDPRSDWWKRLKETLGVS